MANYIESVSGNVQTIDSLFSSLSDTPAISKAITRSFRLSCPTCLEPELSVWGAVTEPDDSSHLEMATGSSKDQLNPKCMTQQDWVEAQSKDPTIGEIFNCLKQRSCTVER